MTSLSKLAATTLMAGALMQAATASAVILDYNAAVAGPTVIEDGFDTTAPAGLLILGGEALIAFAGDQVTISRVGGGAFSLSSIDFRLFRSSSFTFTVFGDQVGGGTASQLISGLTTSMQTFNFGPAFNNLLAVRFTQGPSTGGDDDVFFDNVNVEPLDTVGVQSTTWQGVKGLFR